MPDLVADVAVRRDAVSADEDDIDLASLHQRGPGGIHDQRVRHTPRAQFPCGQPRSLEAWARLADPDMQWNARFVGEIDGCCRRAKREGGQRPRIAMREDLHVTFIPGQALDQG